MTEEVGRASDTVAQFVSADALSKRLELADGRERLRLRLSAVEALRRVREWHADSGDVGARAALAAGIQLGAIGFDEEAWHEFDAAVRLADDAALHAQARLERAHAARRTGAWQRAVDDYRWCAAHESGEPRVAALLRVGDAELELGRSDRARAAWEQALLDPRPCTATVDVFDRLARSALDNGDPEAAAGWLARCAETLGDALRVLTPDGTALRRALVGMRARHELACLALEDATRDTTHSAWDED